MKLLLCFAFVIPFIVNAQDDKRDVLNPDKLAIKELRLEAKEKAPATIKLPFKDIRILDSRFDSSKIGYVPTDDAAGKKRAFKKLALRGGNAHAIETYYNDYYAESFGASEFELLIVMKRFWISGKRNSNNKRMEVANSGKDNSNIHFKWEYYIGKNGSYLPVKRMDTTFIVEEYFKNYLNDILSEKRLYYVKNCLHNMIELLDFTNGLNQFDKQPKKRIEDIADFNKRMNNIPILKDSGFKKGVYLSFEDFKNNHPSIIEFQEKKMRYGTFNANTEVYLENMQGQTISNYWGYSDGKDFRYGMMGNEKIYRIQNTFCFFIKVAGYTIDRSNEAQFGGSSINPVSKDKYEVWVPFQIDMETGEIY